MDLTSTDVPVNFPRACLSASDALDFAAINAKYSYNRKHIVMFLSVGNWALLRLHRGYSIPSAPSSKLDQQFIRPFKVLEKVGRLAYRLDILPHWKIHIIFIIAMLEPSLAPGSDPY